MDLFFLFISLSSMNVARKAASVEQRQQLSLTLPRGQLVRRSQSYNTMNFPGTFRALFFLFSCQDFSNQIRYSLSYAAELKKHNATAGKYVRPATGEFFSGVHAMSKSCFNMMSSLQLLYGMGEFSPFQAGFPSGWTSSEANAVSEKQFFDMFPFQRAKARPTLFQHVGFCHADCQANKLATISLFTGVAGLELGLSQWIAQLCNQEDHCDFTFIPLKTCGLTVLWLQI